MIIEIPSKSDFEDSGMSLLNLAWDVVSALYLDLETSQLEELDSDGQVTDEFWASAQRPLANAVALAQQGAEFLLKARIAEVSPFLLLSGSPRDWPAGCQDEDTHFAQFRSIDAQDLPRVHDAVCTHRLNPEFRSRLEQLRRLRNSIIHTVDKKLRHSPGELWILILDVCHHLLGTMKWIPLRRSYLESVPAAVAYGVDNVDWQLSWESVRLLHALQPAQAKMYLNVDSKQRWYVCYQCSLNCRGGGGELYPRTAQLRPNKAESTRIYCFVCEQEDGVVRADCTSQNCAGNVVHSEDDVCLTCYDGQL